MALRDIGTQRLVNQRIEGQKCDTPAAVVKWMGAMQAQDYRQALWAIGLRTQSATEAVVEQAIADGTVLRTWPMRGTIHFVPPEDAKWMLKLAASRMLAVDGRRMSQLELTIDILARCRDLFVAALTGGKRLTRPDMLALLEDAGISINGQRGYHILWYLSQEGVICMGPMQGSQQTFALFDEWVPESRDLSREEALAELVLRFFTSHGPATVHDFARWAGLTVADARLGLELSQAELISETIDGTPYWTGRNSSLPVEDSAANIHLLPAFDEYALGYKDRRAVLAAEHEQKIVPGNNGMFLPMIVIDGQVVGVWKRKIKRKSLDVTLQPFAHIDDLEAKILAEINAFAAFIGLPASSTILE